MAIEMKAWPVSVPAISCVPFIDLSDGEIDPHRIPFFADRQQQGLVHRLQTVYTRRRERGSRTQCRVPGAPCSGDYIWKEMLAKKVRPFL